MKRLHAIDAHIVTVEADVPLPNVVEGKVVEVTE